MLLSLHGARAHFSPNVPHTHLSLTIETIEHPKEIISKDTLYFFALRLSPKYDSLVILKFTSKVVHVIVRYCSPARLWNSQPGAGV